MLAEIATTAHADTLISYQLDALWRVVHASDGLCRLLHCTPKALIGRNVHDLVPREARASFFRQAARALAGIGTCDLQIPLRTPGGSTVHCEQHLEPFVDTDATLGCHAVLRPLPVPLPVPAWRFHPTPMQLVWDSDCA